MSGAGPAGSVAAARGRTGARAGVRHVGHLRRGGFGHHVVDDGADQQEAHRAGEDPGGALGAGPPRPSAPAGLAAAVAEPGLGPQGWPGIGRSFAVRGSRRRRYRTFPRPRRRRPDRRRRWVGRSFREEAYTRRMRVGRPRSGSERSAVASLPPARLPFTLVRRLGRRLSLTLHRGARSHGACQTPAVRQRRPAESGRIPDRPARRGKGRRAGPDPPLRSGFPPPPVHRHPGHQQERRGAAQPVREGAGRRDHVRRLVHRGVRADRRVGHAAQARPRHLPHPALRRRGRPGRPAAVRHLHPRRGAVRRLPPDHAQAPGRAGAEARASR